MTDPVSNIIRHFQFALREAEKALKDAVAEVQKTCDHPQVVCTPCGSDSFGHTDGMRLCLACGREEWDDWGDAERWGQGGHVLLKFGPKGEDNRVKAQLGTGFVKKVSSTELCRARIS